jgi:hypothetical protein
MNGSFLAVLIVLTAFAHVKAFGQECIMDQYAEWTVDSLVDPVMRDEVLSFYPLGLLDDTSAAELLVVPGRGNCVDRAEFTGNEVSVVIEGAAFDTTKHSFGYDRSQQVAILCNIDGHGFWGCDGDMPHREIKLLRVTVRGRTLSVPKHAYTNLYEPNFCDSYPRTPTDPIALHAGCRLSMDRKRLYVHMMNSDGAGGYLVTWIFQDGRYFGRVVEHGF